MILNPEFLPFELARPGHVVWISPWHGCGAFSANQGVIPLELVFAIKRGRAREPLDQFVRRFLKLAAFSDRAAQRRWFRADNAVLSIRDVLITGPRHDLGHIQRALDVPAERMICSEEALAAALVAPKTSQPARRRCAG